MIGRQTDWTQNQKVNLESLDKGENKSMETDRKENLKHTQLIAVSWKRTSQVQPMAPDDLWQSLLTAGTVVNLWSLRSRNAATESATF